MQAKVYNQEGKSSRSIELPRRIFGRPWNPDLVHQVVTSMRANRRLNLARAKTRGEVSGGGKKPWRQKGTGRARHGSTRSPIWRGGGVTHGPISERDYSTKINRQMKRSALYSVLSAKWRDGQILFLENLEVPEAKTRNARATLEKLAGLKGFDKLVYKNGRRVILALPDRGEGVVRGFRNLGAVQVEETRNLNPLDLLTYESLIVVDPKRSLELLTKTGKDHGKD